MLGQERPIGDQRPIGAPSVSDGAEDLQPACENPSLTLAALMGADAWSFAPHKDGALSPARGPL